jgi:hypothetical protein
MTTTTNIEVGAVVRNSGSSNELTVTAVGKHYFLATSGGAEREGQYVINGPWVKVEPTPADYYIVIDKDGDARADYRSADSAIGDANDRNRSDSVYVPYRVARYTFAEWVEA